MNELYERLHHFITKDMRMSHVYQPVMLAEASEIKGQGNSHSHSPRYP